MIVVILSEDFPPYWGGIAQWARGIACGLTAHGHAVRVITRYRPAYHAPGTHAAEGYAVEHIHGRHWKRLRTWYCRSALRRYFARGDRADLVIATTWNVARGIVGIARARRVPCIVAAHGLEVTRAMHPLKRWWLDRTLRACHRIVAVSGFTAEFLCRHFPRAAHAVRRLPCGVDPDLFAPGVSTDTLRTRLGLDGATIILTLSRVIERKGHAQVIRAMPSVIARVPNAVYLICGPWETECHSRLQTLVASLHLERHVVFVGEIPGAERVIYYNLCDVFVMTSRLLASGDSEGFGICFLEAGACEKPVIGGRSGGVADAVEDEVSGLLVDPENVDAIAEALLRLLCDPALRRRLGSAGRARILRTFTWPVITDSLCALARESS